MARFGCKQILRPAIYASLAGIFFLFAHSGLSGEQGLGALRRAEAQEAELRAELADLRSEREALANRVARLDERYLDLDLLDERIRAVLGHARADEIVIR